MNLSNLRNHYPELFSNLEENGYSKRYIQFFREELNRIFRNEAGNQWTSYTDIYLDYEETPHSINYLRSKRTIIGALEQFDVYNRFPDGRHRHTLFERGTYHRLISEFKELIDYYCLAEEKRGKKATTILHESQNTASFLYQMQERGCKSLSDISEEDVMSFFLSESGQLIRSCSYKKNISAVFKAGISWKEKECQRILSFLPLLRENRKNIQYLLPEEITMLRQSLKDKRISLRNNAVISLLFYTGLRGCDIAALTLNDIVWEHDLIRLTQLKTDVPLELPLTPAVGNAIYDYVTEERPESNDTHLFLAETRPFKSLSADNIGNIVAKVLKISGLRQNPGDRQGTHIFRHNLAVSLLESGVPRPVITQTLGHTNPESLEPYLRANFKHLKECAISIEKFPVNKAMSLS